MPDFAARSAQLAVVVAGCATAAMALAQSGPQSGLAAQNLLLMNLAVGVALVAAASVPALRWPAISAGVLTKLSLLAALLVTGEPLVNVSWQAVAEAPLLVLLLAAGWLFFREARLEAQWNGAASLHLES